MTGAQEEEEGLAEVVVGVCVINSMFSFIFSDYFILSFSLCCFFSLCLFLPLAEM